MNKEQQNCYTCKHYSQLVPVSSEFSECWLCQANHCIFCEHNGVNCDDYEFGENDGGKRDYEYEDDEHIV